MTGNQQIMIKFEFKKIGIVLFVFVILMQSCSGGNSEKAAELNHEGILYAQQRDYFNAEKKFKEALMYDQDYLWCYYGF